MAFAADHYASPTGTGTTCSLATPCSFNSAFAKAVGGDRVRLTDGTYTQNFKTTKGGSSNSARITIEAVNRHQAIIRTPGSNQPRSHFHIDHSWITVRGLRIWALATNGAVVADATKISDGNDKHGPIQGVIFEDNYVHDAGGTLMWTGNTNGVPSEVRHNTFDNSGLSDHFGEALYMGSARDQNPTLLRYHHNVVTRYKANAGDFKGEQRDARLFENFYMDHKFHTGSDFPNHTGDGTFVIGLGDGDTGSASTTNFVNDNVIWRPRSTVIFSFEDGTQIRASGNVVIDWTATPGTSTHNLNKGAMYDPSATYSNIHCPSQGMGTGEQTHGGNPANQVNRPIAECNTRIDAIVGKPTIASCQVGGTGISDTTVLVNINTVRNGPVSSATGLNVTFDGTNQTGEVTTLPANNQARITLTTAPASQATQVRVVSAVGNIKNSAFIGGKTCGNGANFGNTNYTRGQGFCGENAVQTVLCLNQVQGGGGGEDPPPPPPPEGLDQAVFRFYEAHGLQGANPVAPENSSITSFLGEEFRFRVGVRGGGIDALARTYELAARACTPTCGPWGKINNDFSVRGITYVDDQVQDGGAATTNQLSLGGKSFLAGVFIETPVDTPAVAIATTQQIEWEFSLVIPADGNPLVAGNKIELRMQEGNATPLFSYTALPTITIGATAAGRTGSLSGTLQ